MNGWVWLLNWVLIPGLFAWLLAALILELDKLLGWGIVADIPEGHPDQFDSMDRINRGIR